LAIKVLLDTDIGSNIDDALCLAYLLARDDCDLLGITTVSGEADRRAMLASTLCWVAGQAVPIYPGAEAPLEMPQTQPHAPQAAALLRWPHQDRFDRGAVEVEIPGADDSADRLHALTHWTPGGPDAPHEVAVEVDAARLTAPEYLLLADFT